MTHTDLTPQSRAIARAAGRRVGLALTRMEHAVRIAALRGALAGARASRPLLVAKHRRELADLDKRIADLRTELKRQETAS